MRAFQNYGTHVPMYAASMGAMRPQLRMNWMPYAAARPHVRPGHGRPPSGGAATDAAASGRQAAAPSNLPPTETVVLYVPNRVAGAIIGAGGSNIRSIIKASAAHIKVNALRAHPPFYCSVSPPLYESLP